MDEATTKKYAIIIFVLFMALAAALVYVSLIFPNAMRISSIESKGPSNSELVNLQRIESSLVSSEDGSTHDITIDFTLAINEEIKKDLDTTAIQAKISESMKELDYAKVNDVGGMDYIKKEVIRDLEGYINTDDFRGLYIREIRRAPSKFDYYEFSYSESETSTQKPKVKEILEGLKLK